MTMALIAFPNRRTATPTGERICACGSTWFELARRDPDTGEIVAAAVQIDEDGRVVSYAGNVVCAECGIAQTQP